MKTMLFNPYTGKPRDPRDIESDPSGALMTDPDEPLCASAPPSTDATDSLAIGYHGSAAGSNPDGSFKISLYYENEVDGEKAFNSITNIIDAAIAAKEQP